MLEVDDDNVFRDESLQRWNQTSIARHLRCVVLTDDVEVNIDESIVRSSVDANCFSAPAATSLEMLLPQISGLAISSTS